MCLFPVEGYQQMLIRPSDRARYLGKGVKGVIYTHSVLVIAYIASSLYVDGIVDLLGVFIGYLSIRNARGFNFQQVLCYSLYLGMDCFWAAIRAGLFFTGTSTAMVPARSWQYSIYAATVMFSMPFYFIGCVATWKLYRELRSIFTRTLEQGPPVTVHNDSFQPNSEDVLDAGPVSRPSVSRGGGQHEDGMGQSPEFRPFRGKKYSLRE